MSAIACITMNPAVDVAASVPRVMPTAKLRCGPPSVQAGGGGINVARVLTRFGVEAAAIFPAGGANGQRLGQLLAAEGLAATAVPIAEETRESFTVTEAATGDQYRFVLPGPAVTPSEEAAVLAAVRRLPDPPFVVLSGSLPRGVSADFAGDLVDAARAAGARLVVDGPASLLAAVRGAAIVKPNLVELEGLAGRPLASRTDQVKAMRGIIADGIAAAVVLSLGPDGALLATGDSLVAYRAPNVPLVSAVGAGDSMVAGIVAALAGGADVADAVADGVAAGSAAILTPGTELCRLEDAVRLRRDVALEPVADASSAA